MIFVGLYSVRSPGRDQAQAVEPLQVLVRLPIRARQPLVDDLNEVNRHRGARAHVVSLRLRVWGEDEKAQNGWKRRGRKGEESSRDTTRPEKTVCALPRR